MDWLLKAAGVLLIAFMLRDVFQTLFRPSGRGAVSLLVFRSVWAVAAHAGSRARALAGPSALVVVIALWTGGLVVGFALVYWSEMPDGFLYSPSLSPSAQDGFDEALYLSWVTQTTLGYGDVTPRDEAMRLVAPLHATIGFAVFTAAVTWVLSLYPALTRRRTVAAVAHAVCRAHPLEPEMRPGDETALARRMETLAESLATSRVDVIQYPSTFYFAGPDPTLSLADALPRVAELARSGVASPGLQGSAAELRIALAAYAGTIGAQHLGLPDARTEEILAAYRRHQRLPESDPRQAALR